MSSLRALHEKYSELGLWTEERIGWLISSAAARWPERELVCMNGRRYSYSEINRWVLATAQDLTRRGVRPGDRVLLHLSNCLELIVLQLAVWRIGAVSVPVVPIYREHEMRHIVRDSRPRAVVALKSFSDRSPVLEFERLFTEMGAPPVKIAVSGDGSVEGWDEPIPCPSSNEEVSGEGLPNPQPSSEVCLILYTSGTTSAPKGAMLTSRALLSGMDTWRYTLRVAGDVVGLGAAPLAHIAALVSAFLVPMRCGGRTVVLPSWKADIAAEVIAHEGVSLMAGAKIFLQDLVARFETGKLPRPRLTFISGGAATPPSLVERAEAVGIIAARSWGMTETAGTCTLASRDAPLERRARFDGQVSLGAEVKVVDDHGQRLPPGSIGHVLVRSPQLLSAYTDPVVTAEQLDAEGWFKTGDMGVVDAEGWFCMHGRTKDIINRGGEKFSSRDIELALQSCPGIASAAVVGAAHDRLGEEVAACLVLSDGSDWTGPEPVIAHLMTCELAKQKIPTRWLIVERLPMTATGKVQKQILLQTLDAEVPAKKV